MPTANSLAERFVPGGVGAREAIVHWVEALSAESIRERLLNHPLGGLNGPSFFDGTCLDPIITQEDCGFFLIEARKRELRMPVFQPRVPSLEE